MSSQAELDIENEWNAMMARFDRLLAPASWKTLEPIELLEMADRIQERLIEQVGILTINGCVLDAVRVEADANSYTEYPLSIVARFDVERAADKAVGMTVHDGYADGGYERMISSLLKAAHLGDREVGVKLV